MNSNLQNVPAVKPVLSRDLEGNRRQHSWHYRSVIGMLNFLAGSTRPDIAFATNQCARFSADPRKSHENAVKQIAKSI